MQRLRHVTFIFALTALILMGTLSPPAAHADGPIAWKTYTEGMALAKSTQKKVFIFFSAAWCHFCEQMGADTFQNSDILRILEEEYVSIKVDTDQERQLASQYRVRGLPDIWFIDSSGNAIANRVGYAPAGTLIKIFTHIRSAYGAASAAE